MRLTSQQIQSTLDQFDAQALPDNHPAVSQLNEVYGDHTYFLDDEGLHIVEAAAAADDGAQGASVVKLASWADAQHTMLAPHEPQVSDVVIELGSEESFPQS